MIWKKAKRDSARASDSRRRESCVFDRKGSRKEERRSEEKEGLARARERERERARGRDGRVGGGKMERLSYETQRQLPRSPPPQLLPAYREIRAPRRRPDPFPPFSAEWIEQTCNTRAATPDTRSPTATRAAFALIDRDRAVAEARYRCISAPPRTSALIFGPPGRCVTRLR